MSFCPYPELQPTRTGLRLEIPGKTILMGEYAALEFGEGLVISHEPSYTFEVFRQEAPSSQDLQNSSSGLRSLSELFHPESPAGKWISQFPELTREYPLAQFTSGFSQGGFGASSAEFLSVYLLSKQYSRQKVAQKNHSSIEVSRTELLNNFWSSLSLAELNAKKSSRPSGIDLLAQSAGLGLFHVARDSGSVVPVEWPFLNLTLCLIPTGMKMKTHDHLAQLDLTSHRFHRLQEILVCGSKALDEKDERGFLKSIREYKEELNFQKLLTSSSEEFLNQLSHLPGYLCGKGCGAMGADVVLAVVESEKLLQFKHELSLRIKREFFVFPRAQKLTQEMRLQQKPRPTLTQALEKDLPLKQRLESELKSELKKELELKKEKETR